jgi:transposase
MARTSTPWSLLPAKELGCGSATTCCRRLDEWAKAGVFEQLQAVLLDELSEAGRVDVERVSVDSFSLRAVNGGDLTGATLVDRGKQGSKLPLAGEAGGLPLAVILSAANANDATHAGGGAGRHPTDPHAQRAVPATSGACLRAAGADAALLELAGDRGCPVIDRLPVAVVALARMRHAHRRLLGQAQLAQVQLPGEQLELARLGRLDQPVDQPGSHGVGVVADRWIAHDGAAGEQPGRALGELGRVGVDEAARLLEPPAQVPLRARVLPVLGSLDARW